MNKVLMVSCEGLGHGGVQDVIMNIVRGGSDKQHFDILVFTNEKRYYDEEFSQYGKILRLPHRQTLIDYYFRFFRIFLGTYKLLKGNDYNAIHCHNGWESGICLLAARLAGVNIRIAHFHEIFDNRTNPLKKLYNKFYGRLIQKNATKIIACSERSLDSFVGSSAKSEIIMNPIPLDRFKADFSRKRRLDFIHVGRFCDTKNQLFIVEVFSRIAKKHSDATLSLVGFNDDYKQKIILSAESLGLKIGKNLFFPPSDGNIAEYFANADYMIFPSLREGLGIALIEAQASGVECFVSDTVPQEANAGLCTFYSLNDGSQRWAEYIEDYISGSDRTVKEPDMSRFDLKIISKRYDEIYSGRGKAL